jgi:stage II sporulation protein AA (anti-sigma F factor antagonist)
MKCALRPHSLAFILGSSPSLILKYAEFPHNERCNQNGLDSNVNGTFSSQRSLGQTTVLALSGRLDSETSSAVEPLIMEGAHSFDRMVLDFSEVTYVSSAGLRIVLMAAKRVQQANGVFALCSLKPEIQKIFEMSGLFRILSIFGSPEDAAEKLNAP